VYRVVQRSTFGKITGLPLEEPLPFSPPHRGLSFGGLKTSTLGGRRPNPSDARQPLATT